MAVEHARTHLVHKIWGSKDLRPWSGEDAALEPVGEIWFERADAGAPAARLLLKLLFTTAPLSIQVHPDDAEARARGLANGKSEAWYVLDGVPGARVAIGLKRSITAGKLRSAIEDGSIANLVEWRGAQKDDAISVPAGTIHAIGAGLVVAEIQQRSDTTFCLFDYGRKRALHLEEAVASAEPGPAVAQALPRRLTDARTLLVAGPHFVLERIELPPKTQWALDAEFETWLLTIEGGASLGRIGLGVGEALFLSDDQAILEVGAKGLKCLVAYTGSIPAPNLLARPDWNLGLAPTGRAERKSASMTEAKL